MSDTVRIELLPLGLVLTAERGTSLQDLLFTQGVEFPCGGRGRCKGCRIKLLEGSLPITADDHRLLQPAELDVGWRLSCRAIAQGNLKLELAQWETTILTDSTTFAFTPGEGLGIAVDIGTTTLVAQLLDLQTGHVLGVRTALNPQARHGADIMSRIDFAVMHAGQPALERLIREQIGSMVTDLMTAAKDHPGMLRHVVLVGNTVMHHLFSGIDVRPLSHNPFEPLDPGLQLFNAVQLGWKLRDDPEIRFLPCMGSFVGSDIMAGVLATRLHESEALVALVDLGTNGEIVVGNRDKLLCASTAAGPAFEGARISMGMRAATGAIAEVTQSDGQLRCHVLGNAEPRGVCGSGLVDAVAAALDLGWIQLSGRLAGRNSVPLAGPVELNQQDIRELQLAKGAIAAGIRLLARQFGSEVEGITRIYLAGAFGNYISRRSARRIGLLQFPIDKVLPSGNTALLGAKIAMFNLQTAPDDWSGILKRTRHLSLNEDEEFQNVFVDEMAFPEAG